ncbi:pentapeptide repeat-containing protein [Streptomyces sp. NPDC054855]
MRQARARQKARDRRWHMGALIAMGVLALVAGLPWLVWRGPYVLDGEYLDRSELAKGSAALVTGLRTAIVACVAALGAGIALLYTARTYRLTRRGQITERFTKALERLGSDHRYVRIGGILALEQIVRDAPEQAATDAARVLGHFIRDRAPKALPATPAPQPDESTPDSASPAPEKLPPELEADVQAALTALTRTESRTHVDPREVLDLHGLHLAGAQLPQADLTGANLRGATLTKANLRRATLTGADLLEATLVQADLHQATLTQAKLRQATLTQASLYEATLTMADLYEATLTKASLSGATLTGADLSRAKLTEADLSGAKLTRASLHGADLSHVYGFTQSLADRQTDESTILPPEPQHPATPG